MTTQQRRDIADRVANILADEYRVYVNTQGLHWNVEGPLFYSVHKLTESQYRELNESIDSLAERIRALGLPAPQSVGVYEENAWMLRATTAS